MFELGGSGAEPLETGDPLRIGSIPLAGRLGAGGMGRVYLGVHEGRYVAVKQLLSSVVGEDADFLRRFGHELDNLSRLPAEATAPLLASDRTAMPPWFATAYVPGLTLSQAVTLHGGPLPADALWSLLRGAAAALASVHALDMVHRDIKPSNVMLTLDGLTLIDFGVARATEQSQLTRTGMVVGTPAYMAPEQASGSRGLSGATDVFALASALGYAACGRPPFGDDSGHGVLYRIVHEQPDMAPLRELDSELAELVAACLDKDPDGRPTAAELLESASRRAPSTGPLWPAVITERLTERAAFAASTQKIDTPTVPLTGGSPEPESKPEPKAEPQPKPEPKAEPQPKPTSGARPERAERRRKRLFLAVVPVVATVGGTTLAIQLLPYMSSPQATEKPGPSASVSAPADPGSTGGTGPSGTASPSASPGKDKGKAGDKDASGEKGAEDDEGKEPDGAGGSEAAAGGGTGTGAVDPDGSDGAGDADTPGDSGADGSGGAAASGGGGSGPSSAAPPPSSGTYRYRNGDNSLCITQTYGGSDQGSCSDSTARWTVRSQSGGFKLVNQQTGQCLYANMLGQAVFVGDCAQEAGRIWRNGSGGSLVSAFNGGCLDVGTTSFLVTSTCAGESSQRWTRES
ncbi:protein kinase [Streptomyces sp. NBC_00234]|uniref:protein kinase domain-containing protein n=1 Tax=Streptomyces sp. NBC_00234 TaxID=2903638 RepID=UPI002E29A9B0|nr:protein kinase [Streptomyces sp. NBC_00234]